jgi:K+-transporting ATPase c subunit
MELIDRFSKQPGGALAQETVVNVLLLNMKLDRMNK